MQNKTFFIAGVQHHNLHTILEDLEEGNELDLIPEPANKDDSNAVRIEHSSLHHPSSVMCGYVPKKFSAEVSAAIELDDSELECIITALNKTAKPWKQCEVTIRSVGEIERVMRRILIRR